MLNDPKPPGLFSIAELNYLRLEAMDLYERCLTENKTELFEAFIEQQISNTPPRTELLREVADDLHQRLLSLREYHADVRDRIIRTLREDYQVDIASLVPSARLHRYHLLKLNQILNFVQTHNSSITALDDVILRKLLEASLEVTVQLYNDILLTERLSTYISDWLSGLNATLARRLWNTGNSSEQSTEIH